MMSDEDRQRIRNACHGYIDSVVQAQQRIVMWLISSTGCDAIEVYEEWLKVRTELETKLQRAAKAKGN
jgi:hypothetical protein